MSDKDKSTNERASNRNAEQEQGFSDWLDGKLSASEGQDLQNKIEQNAELSLSAETSVNKDHSENKEPSENEKAEQLLLQRMKTAKYVAHQAEILPEQEVPKWDRAASFVSDKEPWWQWRALPAMSMAFSIFAIGLVLFRVELVLQPEGLMLSFGNTNSVAEQAQYTALVNEEVERQVDQKLKEFASEQQVILANYAADIKVKQQDNNLQLASYIMGASRQERKEDMTDFIGYYNEQRKDEQFDQKIKFNQLERAIKTINSTGKQYKVIPANLIIKE
ncbi:MAG: hypothetical protein HRT38_15130 [Alteromonadaceae bacterium]|nr:hypothetical protein [Alteromonadaceae bacterium]